MSHTATHMHTHRDRVDRWSTTCCKGCAQNVWILGCCRKTECIFHHCWEESTALWLLQYSPPTSYNEVKKVLPHIWWSDSLAYLKFWSTYFSQFYSYPVHVENTCSHVIVVSMYFGAGNISATWEKFEVFKPTFVWIQMRCSRQWINSIGIFPDTRHLGILHKLHDFWFWGSILFWISSSLLSHLC